MPSAAEALQHVEGRAVVAEEHALGDLELEPVGGDLVAGEGLADEIGERGEADLLGADVERDRDRFGPGRGGAARFLDHPLADGRHQAHVFGDRDEGIGGHEAAGRVVPADERLEADQHLALGADQRLIDQVELARGDGGAQVGLEADAILLLRLQRGGEIAGAAAARILGLVEREVGLEDEVVDGRAVDRAEGAADRDADDDLGLVDANGSLIAAMMRSASCWTFLRLWPSVTTMANSSPPMRPTWPSTATSSTSRLATPRRTASPLGWP